MFFYCSPDGTGANFCYVSGVAARACRDVQVRKAFIRKVLLIFLAKKDYFLGLESRFLKQDQTASVTSANSSLTRLVPPRPGTSALEVRVVSSPMLEKVTYKLLMVDLEVQVIQGSLFYMKKYQKYLYFYSGFGGPGFGGNPGFGGPGFVANPGFGGNPGFGRPTGFGGNPSFGGNPGFNGGFNPGFNGGFVPNRFAGNPGGFAQGPARPQTNLSQFLGIRSAAPPTTGGAPAPQAAPAPASDDVAIFA